MGDRLEREVGPTLGLSGINSTRQYSLLANPARGKTWNRDLDPCKQ